MEPPRPHKIVPREFGDKHHVTYKSVDEAKNVIIFDRVVGKDNLGRVLQSWHEDLHLDITKKPILKIFKMLDLT